MDRLEPSSLCVGLVTSYLVCLSFYRTPGPSEAEGFQLEMSGLLAELACPYSVLTSGDVTQRLLNKNDCLLLLCTNPAFENRNISVLYVFPQTESLTESQSASQPSLCLNWRLQG